MPNASVDVTTVRQRFNYEWAMSEPVDGLDTYWWWARSIRVDPNEVIADDDEGNLWSVSFTYDEPSDTVTFGQPVKVRETFIPVQTGDGAAAEAVVSRRRQTVLAAALEKPVKDPKAASRPRPNEEVPTVALDIPALRSRLQLSEESLPDDATEEMINAALAAEAPAPEPEPVENVVPEPETEPAADRTVSVSAAQWKDTQDRLAKAEQDLQTRATAEATAHRDGLITAAKNDGRITPAEAADWRADLDKWPEATEAALGRLQPGRVPTEERGVAASEETLAQGEGTGWFEHKLSKEA
jgi:hypothetical protein